MSKMDVPGGCWILILVVMGGLVVSECKAVEQVKRDIEQLDENIDKIARNAHASPSNNEEVDFGLVPPVDYGPKPIIESQPAHQDGGKGRGHKVRVHKVHHKPGNTQQQKVEEVQRSGENVTSEKVNKHPTAAPIKQGKGIHPIQNAASMADVYFLAVVAGCSVAGLVGLVVAGVCWYRLQKNVKAASEAEYPAYGVTGPTKERVGSPGDRKLAQSAQMYHYQHQKQQMIALERANGGEKHDGTDEDSEEENEEGDYTVYECPGLAPTGEMEVKNPLFSEETPVTPTANGGELGEGSHK